MPGVLIAGIDFKQAAFRSQRNLNFPASFPHSLKRFAYAAGFVLMKQAANRDNATPHQSSRGTKKGIFDFRKRWRGFC
jgi:hypothetical protein